jgi:hypothetical protein
MGFVLAAPAGARAGILVLQLDTEFSGGTPPEGAAPWLTVTIDDGGAAGSVTLTLAATNLTDAEFVSQWNLNLDPLLDPTDLIFSAPTKVGTFDSPTISTGVDAFTADGGGKYDIDFAFATSGAGGGVHRFGVGDSVQYTVTGVPTLVASSFDFFGAPHGNHGPFETAAHVQAIGSSDSDSGWVTGIGVAIPEPASAALVLSGLAAVIALRRRR